MKLLRSIFEWLRQNKIILTFFAIILFILLTNSLHEEYSDEFDSLVGGKYILQGKLIYRDWFQHHQPGAYMVAAGIVIVTGQSFFFFRLGLASFYIVYQLLIFLLLKKSTASHPDWLKAWLAYIFITTIGATYFWAQMLLADTLAILFLAPAYFLLLISSSRPASLDTNRLFTISLLLFFSWWTSLTTTPIILGLNVYTIYLFLKLHNINLRKSFINSMIILSTPYLLFFLSLAATGSLSEWYFANITYNSNYYIYNYPRTPGTPVNPLRYGVSITNTFLQNYLPTLTGFVKFPLTDPTQTTIAVGHAGYLLYLMITRKWLLAGLVTFVIVFTTTRVNPQTIRETDYQSISYAFFGLLNGLLAAFGFRKLFDEKSSSAIRRLIAGGGFIIITLYLVFTTYSFTGKFSQKMTDKYMGMAPLVYDRPEVAPLVNDVVDKNDYAWVGPFAFEELFFLNTKIPSRYHWFLQHANSSTKIKTKLLDDFTKNRPRVIVFNRKYAPWGGDASTFNKFFTDFLDENYLLLNQIKHNGKTYAWTNPERGDWRLDSDFYIRKDTTSALIPSLLDKKYIR